MLYWYHAYGLTISSEIACPGFLPLQQTDSLEAQVSVRRGEVPTALESPVTVGVLFQAAPGCFLLNMPGIGRYLALDGERIVVESEPGGQEEALSLFLHEPVMGALLQQRGRLTLHGSAIQTAKGAVAFLGGSASGKSTLAAALAERGWRVLADEICAIQQAATGELLLFPSAPALHLWADMLEELGLDEQQLKAVRPGRRKYILPLGERYAGSPAVLTAIYCLNYTNQPAASINLLGGMFLFSLLKRLTYMPRYIAGFGMDAGYFRQLMTLLNSVPVATLSLPERPVRLAETLDLLEQDWR